MTTQLLFPDCVLPGCRNPVEDHGVPCDECLRIFGDCLQETDRPALTAERIEARDSQVRFAYIANQELVDELTEDDMPAAAVAERKRNQICWLCDQRRTCTWMPMGWECDTCQEIEA